MKRHRSSDYYGALMPVYYKTVTTLNVVRNLLYLYFLRDFL